jgi:outer membrane protein TolC
MTLFIYGHMAMGSGPNLGALIEEAKSNNPELIAMRQDYEAAKSRISGFRYLMDPMLSLEWNGETMMYGLSQQVPFPTKITAQSKYAALDAKQHYQEYLSKVQSVIREVKDAYTELYLAHKKYGALEKSTLLLSQIYDVTAQKYAIGHAMQAEVLRAQVELSRSENELHAAKDDITIAEAILNAVLNRKIDDPIGKPGEPETTLVERELEELYDLAKEHKPQLKAYGLMYDKTEVMKSMARQTYLPDFMLEIDQMDNAMQDRKYMVGVTFPLWFWGKQNNMVREAAAERQMALAMYKVTENEVVLAVKKAKLQVDRNRRRAELYGSSILPQAEAALKSTLAEYRVNESGFLMLIDNLNLLVQLELEYAQAQADYFMAIAELEESIGTVE